MSSPLRENHTGNLFNLYYKSFAHQMRRIAKRNYRGGSVFLLVWKFEETLLEESDLEIERQIQVS